MAKYDDIEVAEGVPVVGVIEVLSCSNNCSRIRRAF